MKSFAFTMLTCLLAGWISTCSASTALTAFETSDAPKPVGAWSQAISVDLENTKNLIFVCGQVPYNHITKKMVDSDIRAATNQTLDNVGAILTAAGSDWDHVVRMDVFLLNFDQDWDGMNEEYSKRFPNKVYPARQTVGVQLDPDTLVEISCIAIVPK